MNARMAVGLGNGVASGALWGVVFLAPAVLSDFTALQLAAGRYLIYGLLAVVLLAPRWPVLKSQVTARHWRALAGLSLLGNLVYFLLLVVAVQWCGGGATSLIVGMVPVLVAVVAARAPGAVPLRRLAPSLGLCVAGVGLMSYSALHATHVDGQLWQRVVGLLCAVGALVAWTVYSVRNSVWLARSPEFSGHDWSLLTGVATGALALLLVPLAVLTDGGVAHTLPRWAVFAGICAAVAVMASVLGNACWNRASRLLPLSLAGQMIVFETLFALLYGFAWQRRWPTAVELVAIACLVGGVVACTWAHRNHPVDAALVDESAH